MAKLRNTTYKGKNWSVKKRPLGEYQPSPPKKFGWEGREENKKKQKEVGFSLEAFCEDCYLNKLMSCYQIAEILNEEYGFNYTPRWIHMILSERGITRSQSESMKIRVITGRMDYKKRIRGWENIAREKDKGIGYRKGSSIKKG